MNKWYFLLLLGIIIISGCSKKIIDCGTDQACFVKNLKTCTPAKVGGGAMEVKGGTSKNCQVYFEGGYDPFKEGEAAKEKMKMICTISDTNAIDGKALSGEFAGIALIELISKSQCQGSYYDFLAPSLNQIKSTNK